MRDPTSKELADFRRAAGILDKLGRAGFKIYLANDTLNLMTGPSHDDSGRPQRDSVREECCIRGAGGGDW